jgi:hypothetical protein
MPQTKGMQPNAEDQAFLTALKEQMPPDMPVQRILAITSQFVGQLVALAGSSRRSRSDMAMQIVQENIVIGNQAMRSSRWASLKVPRLTQATPRCRISNMPTTSQQLDDFATRCEDAQSGHWTFRVNSWI